MELGVEVACHHCFTVGADRKRKLLEDVLVLVHLTELRFEALVDGNRGYWLIRHGEIPHLHRKKVSGCNVPFILHELH